MKYDAIHILPNSVRTQGIIKRMVTVFPNQYQCFYVLGAMAAEERELKGVDVIYENTRCGMRCWYLWDILKTSDVVVLHSINDSSVWRLIILLACQVFYKHKMVWAVWGHDVYDAYWRAHKMAWKHPLLTLKCILIEQIRKMIIRRIYIVLALQGDYRTIKKWYKTDAKFILFNQVSYGEMSIVDLPENEKRTGLQILVGHGPYPHCRHIETLKLIKRVDDGKIEIVCPLGSKGKRAQLVDWIIQEGVRLFGDRFQPILEWTSYEEFCKIANTVDIAIFNHNRQMAEGTAVLLLYYGRKVYFSDENCNEEFFSELGARVFNIRDIVVPSFYLPLTEEDKRKNKEIITVNLSNKEFEKNWKFIFELESSSRE